MLFCIYYDFLPLNGQTFMYAELHQPCPCSRIHFTAGECNSSYICTLCFVCEQITGNGLKVWFNRVWKGVTVGARRAGFSITEESVYVQQMLFACTVIYMWISASHCQTSSSVLCFLPSSWPVITPGRHWSGWNGCTNHSSSTCRCVPVVETQCKNKNFSMLMYSVKLHISHYWN